MASGYRNIRLFDMAFDTKEFIAEEASKDQPDVIGLSTDSISFFNGVAVLSKIKARYKGGIHIIGGVHPTIAPKQALIDSGAAIAVIGEGEKTIVELVDAVKTGKGYEGIRGIAYIEHGRYTANEPREFIEDLDTLPFPSRNLLPMERYLKTPADIPMLYPTINIFASRGCKGNCIYCQPVARRLFGHKMRHRSVDNIIDEIMALKKLYSFKSLYFTDDELLFCGKDWIEELCNNFIEKRLNLKWSCQARVDQIDEDLIKLMKIAGCYAIGMGVESGSDDILRYMRKGYGTGKIDKGFAICRRNKIITTCNLMIGTPGETHRTIQESVEMIRRTRPNLVRCSITTPTPGSDLHVQMSMENRVNIKELSHFDRWAAYPIRLDSFSKEDIEKSIKRLLFAFYTNLFSLFINPARFIDELYFIRVLILRYVCLLKTPRVFLRDVAFYIRYFTHRKGYDPSHRQ